MNTSMKNVYLFFEILVFNLLSELYRVSFSFSWLVPELFCLLLGPRGSIDDLLLVSDFKWCFW